MDDILENEIKFKENLLRTYLRLSEKSGICTRRQQETMDSLLDDLSKLYKKRKK